MASPDTVEMSWMSGRGNTVTRDVKQTLDVRDFVGTAGYPMLVIAANTHLSISELERYLDRAGGHNGRSRSWIQRRRWVFQPPGTDNTKGRMPDEDRVQARAVKIMRQCPRMSVRELTLLLKDNGINRSREWVRKHRCDATV